jgi:hypothetical protein
MDKNLEESLKQKYPEMLANAGKIWCDDGWHPIISSALACIEIHLKRNPKPFQFTQIKEKFSGLRMYNEGADEYIQGVISMAETMSYKTCEVTGEPGVRCVKGGYIRTLSPAKAEELGFSVFTK